MGRDKMGWNINSREVMTATIFQSDITQEVIAKFGAKQDELWGEIVDQNYKRS